jgi:hypothetical protein
MRPFEDELRRALQRREPPPGFTGRVMARVRQEADAHSPAGAKSGARAARRSLWFGWSWFGPRLRFGLAAVAACLLLAVSLSVWQRHREELQRREGEAARAQVMEALRITSAKLNHVRAKVEAATGDGTASGNSERERLED